MNFLFCNKNYCFFFILATAKDAKLYVQKNSNLMLYQNNYSNNNSKKQYTNITCIDPMREFNLCGSSCPVTCVTRNYPRCANDKCVSGCFCSLPYVILDSTNLFESK